MGKTPKRPKLEALLREAAKHVMTREEIIEQKISFVYGQMMDCAPHITRDQVAKAIRERGE